MNQLPRSGFVHVGFDTSISIDGTGKAHISYIYLADWWGELKYATNASGTWAMEMVDYASSDIFSNTSIAIDKSGGVHISYLGYDTELKYATNASGSWTTTVVDTDGLPGYFSSIATDGFDKIHICYYDREYRLLKYATGP